MRQIEKAKQTAKKRDQARLDLFINTYSGFGGTKDPLVKTTFGAGSELSKSDLENLYRFDWTARRIIECVAEDATREWIDIKSADDKDNKIVTDLTGRMETLNVQSKIEKALILARLYGGAVIIIGALDGGAPDTPLNEDKITEVKFFNCLDRWQLSVESYYSDPMEDNFGEPEIYRLNPLTANQSQQNQRIHESRLVRFDGAYLPDVLKLQNSGWYDSELIPLNEELKRFGVSIQSGAVLMQDFITKKLKIPNLADLLQTSEGQTALLTRVQYAISNASSLGITLLGEEEEFDKIQTPISGLVDLINLYVELISASSKIPRARLFSQQLGTLAGASETTRAYYDMVKNYQNKKLKDQLEKIIRIMLKNRASITKGKEPTEWGFEFKPLWQPTEKERAEVRKMVAETDKIYIVNQVLTPEEVTASRFGPDGYSTETMVDFKLREEFEKEAKVKENENEGEEKTKE